jgi:EpsI family protein
MTSSHQHSVAAVDGRLPAGGRIGSTVRAPLLIVFGSLLLTAVLYWPTSLEFADLWGDTVRRRYTHGWFTLAVTLWLIWRDRANLASIPLVPARGGWVLVACGSVGWLIGFNAGLLALTTLALPLLALATIWAVGGWPLARRVTFAVMFLYFALPVWELVSAPLQTLTAFVSLWLTRLAGIPVTMDDRTIYIPEGWFEIAGGCNGLHFLIVALAIATVHGEIGRDDLRTRFWLLCIAAVLALVTNWLRVFIIIVAGHLTDMQHFLVRIDHYYFGWFLFAFALLFYFYLASRVPSRAISTPWPAPAGAAKPSEKVIVAAVLTAVALGAGPAWSQMEPAGDETVRATPMAVDGWSGPEVHLSDWRPLYANPDEEVLVTYHSESAGDVALYRAVYHSQRQGKELLGHGNSVVGERHRTQASTERAVIVSGETVRVSEQLVRSMDGSELLIWSLYTVDGRPSSMQLSDQLAYGLRSMVRVPSAGVIAFAASCRPSCDTARGALEALASQVLPATLTPPATAHEDTAVAPRD